MRHDNFYPVEVDDLRRKDRSKGGKHSRPFVDIRVLTSVEDITLAQVVFPGNQHDRIPHSIKVNWKRDSDDREVLTASPR